MSRRFINRVVLLSYLALVTFSITWSIQSASSSGFILSLLSLAAGIHFFYLLNQLKRRETGSDPEL